MLHQNLNQFTNIQDIKNIDQEIITIDRISNLETINSFLEEVKCPICYNILINPLNCKQCEKCFCYVCYQKWKHYSNKTQCPCCLNNIDIQAQSQIPRVQLSLLNKLLLFCKAKNQGCQKIIEYRFRVIHEQECQYALVQCHNLECLTKVERRNQANHEYSCEFNKIPCQLCGQLLPKQEFSKHVEEFCNQRKISCQWCQQMIIFSTFELHVLDCPGKFQKCSKCNVKYSREEYYNHTNVQCLEQQISFFKEKYQEEQVKNKELEQRLEKSKSLLYILELQFEELDAQQRFGD